MAEEDEVIEHLKRKIDSDELKPAIDNLLVRAYKYIGDYYRGAFEDIFDKDNSNNQTLCTTITCRDGAWNVLYFKKGLLYDIHLDVEKSYCLKENKLICGDLKCNGYKQIFDLSSIKHYLNPEWKMDWSLGRYDYYGTSLKMSDKDFYESLNSKQQDFLKNTVYFSEMNISE